MTKLALLGGLPIRKKPFFSSVIIDSSERKKIMKVLKNRQLSRFMGSPSPDIDKLLVMPSVETEKYHGQYFSFLGGQIVRKFESVFASKFKTKYAITVNSATSGLICALGAAGIGPGDEVITTCMSFNATAISILLFNAIPVFVDVDSKNFCLDPEKIEKAITPHTKAILVVHLLGNAADMRAIKNIAQKYKLVVVEDCAQAPGTKYNDKYVGTIGNMGIFSFQETKNISTGEGGIVITDNPLYAKRVRLIRNHGESIPDESWSNEELVNIIGMNFRMTELTAALGLAQMEKLDKNNQIRTVNYQFLANGLKDLPGISVPGSQRGTVPHIFALCYDAQKTGVKRVKILAALRAEGIPVGSGYLRTMYENPIFLKKIAYGKKQCPWSCHLYKNKIEYRPGDSPVAEKLLRENFIWFHHINRPNSLADMEDVIKAFKKVFNNLKILNEGKFDTRITYKW